MKPPVLLMCFMYINNTGSFSRCSGDQGCESLSNVYGLFFDVDCQVSALSNLKVTDVFGRTGLFRFNHVAGEELGELFACAQWQHTGHIQIGRASCRERESTDDIY